MSDAFNDMINQSNNMKISNGEPNIVDLGSMGLEAMVKGSYEMLKSENTWLKAKLERRESDMQSLEASYNLVCAANDKLKEINSQLKEDLDAAKEAYILISELYDKHMAVGG